MIEDTAKRLDELYVRLDAGQVPSEVLNVLGTVVSGLQQEGGGNIKDVDDAALALNLLASRYSDEMKWIIGVKRLVDCLHKIQ